MFGEIKAFFAKIASWPMKIKIIVASVTAGTLIIASVGGVMIYRHFDAAEAIAEENTQPETTTRETETEPEPEEAQPVVTELVEIPEFASCSVSSSSIEKDLTLYIKGADKKKIAGEAFEIKLIDPDDEDKLADAIAAIDEINEQIKNAPDEVIESTTGDGVLILGSSEEVDSEVSEEENKAPEAENKAPETESGVLYLSSVSGKELTEKEELLLEKETVLEAYKAVLDSLSGETYTDTDSDGMIYIESIDSGDYVACLVPTAHYDADDYTVSVNVKEKVEYHPVENIEDKTVSEAVAGDVEEKHEEIVVESVAVDTVEWVDTDVIDATPEYVEAKAAQLVASVSGTNTATATKKGTSSEGGGDSQATQTTQTTQTTQSPQTTEPTDSAQPTQALNLTEDAAPQLRSEMPSAPAQTSTLSVGAQATLYSDAAGADSIALNIVADNVTNLSVSSSNTANLAVTGSGNSYTITATGATKDVTATVTFAGTDVNGESISAVCTVTIIGSSARLKDAEEHVLYLDNQGQTPAYNKDYSADATFYYDVNEGVKIYYGWQTLDGSRYYFDKNGNKVTGSQVIMGNHYTFGSDGSLLTSGYGIDVSKWQGEIDWAQASTAVSFAIVRAGFRGTNGGISVDKYAGTNIKNAKANGVKVGLYFYSRAVNEVQAVEEASLAISIAKQYGGISLPIYIDMEADNQKSISTAERDAVVKAFCETVKNAGYQAGVYANKNWLTNYLTPSSYTGYSIWCAQYNTTCTYTGRYDIWQYTSKGTVPGIKGNVDMNQSYF